VEDSLSQEERVGELGEELEGKDDCEKKGLSRSDDAYTPFFPDASVH